MEGSTASAVIPARVIDPARPRERQALRMAIIEVPDLVKRYGDHTAMSGVGFTVEQGEIVGFDTRASTTIPRCLSRHQSPQIGSTGCAAL